ncbi:MAG: hypothetical protein H0X17_18465 [Deltaproteobacteria bacterium]|nr:hypothetical protein [Deltaproteobacteria bacterium]
MLARLKRETKHPHAAAGTDRLQLASVETSERYARFLGQIWGFEAPVEAAFARTAGLAELVDLRARTAIRMLRADLTALGVTSPSSLPSTHSVPVLQLADALGWMFVIERNAAVHAEVCARLADRLPRSLSVAGSYLSSSASSDERSVALGTALDRIARTPELVLRITDAAVFAFARQRQWYRQPVPASSTARSHSVA